MASAKITVLLDSCSETSCLMYPASCNWLTSTRRLPHRGKKGWKEGEEAEIWGDSSSHSEKKKKKRHGSTFASWEGIQKPDRSKRYQCRSGMEHLWAGIPIMEKPRTMLNKSRTAAFHSIFAVLRSELWYLERIEPHKSCWGLANKNLSYKGGSVNGTLLEKGKR